MKMVAIIEILTVKLKVEAIEETIICDFVRIDPSKEDFDVHKTMYEIFRQIKKSPIDKVSHRSLGLQFK